MSLRITSAPALRVPLPPPPPSSRPPEHPPIDLFSSPATRQPAPDAPTPGVYRSLGDAAELWTHPVPGQKLYEVAERVCDIYRQLAGLPSLEPSPEVNRLFEELVSLTSTSDDHSADLTLNHPRVKAILPQLREICSRGEGLLERHWFERVTGSEAPEDAIRAFPYYANYEELTRMEVRAMEMAGGNAPKRLLFIGSGPMPLTSLLLARDHGYTVDNLDIDARSANEGELLTRSQGLGTDRMRFAHGDVFSVSPAELAQYDGFYVAALAGMDPKEKEEIFKRISDHAKPGSLVVARSAFRLRKLLYSEVKPEDLKGFSPQVLVHPFNDVVNSVLVARKDDAGTTAPHAHR